MDEAFFPYAALLTALAGSWISTLRTFASGRAGNGTLTSSTPSVKVALTSSTLAPSGSGSSRFSSRNRQVAEFLGGRGFATLLLDLLTVQEEAIDEETTEYRFDIARLGPRVSAAADWAVTRADTRRQ